MGLYAFGGKLGLVTQGLNGGVGGGLVLMFIYARYMDRERKGGTDTAAGPRIVSDAPVYAT